MSKRILAIAEAVPHCNHGGGGIQNYSAVRAFRDRGHSVRVVVLNSDQLHRDKEKEHFDHLHSLGIETELLPPREQGFLRKQILRCSAANRSFPGLARRPEVASRIRAYQPDGIFTYHWNAISAAYRIRLAPKFALATDPAHLPRQFRSEFANRNEKVSWLRGIRQRVRNAKHSTRLRRWMLRFLADCDACGNFAAHHAREFELDGIPRCHYLQTPVPNPGQYTTESDKSDVFKIMHIGHLRGIATLTGVELLANEVLPRLDAALGEKFELHLVGGFYETMPARLRETLQRFRQVKIRGQISPPDREFLSSHIVLVPTPIELGMRVRVATAFSYGNCVVVHPANRLGIPELQHRQNCLLGETGESLAAQCLEVAYDRELRLSLEKGAQQTYEQFFEPNIAGGRIADVMDQMLSVRPSKSVARAA